MAVIRYKCNVCKREIDLVENRKGLEVMNRCVITEGCRGKLYRIDRKQDFIRGEFPPKVPGLEDYTQRRVLYNHEQNIKSREWFVEHNLGVAPAVEVLTERVAENSEVYSQTPCELRDDQRNFFLSETTDFTITITSPNTLTITFGEAESGLAQLVARSSAARVVEEAVEEETPVFRLTNNNSLLTIATLNSSIDDASAFDLHITYTAPGDIVPIEKIYTVEANVVATSPWNDFTNVLIQGRSYKTRSFNTFVSEMSTGEIPDGSSFYFSAVNTTGTPRSTRNREIFLLLALDPYANVDKVTDRLIDISAVTEDNAELSFFHRDRELYAFTPVLVPVFPHLREV